MIPKNKLPFFHMKYDEKTEILRADILIAEQLSERKGICPDTDKKMENTEKISEKIKLIKTKFQESKILC